MDIKPNHLGMGILFGSIIGIVISIAIWGDDLRQHDIEAGLLTIGTIIAAVWMLHANDK